VAGFYADENFRYPVVEALRRLGHDVLTCQEDDLAGKRTPDDVVLERARKANRILITQNRGDFKKLHGRGRPHTGIVLCTYDPDADALALRISEAVSQQRLGGRWLVSIVRPGPRGKARK
jgi:hypothetical protein